MSGSRDPLVFCFAAPVGAWHPFLPTSLESLVRQQGPVRIALLDASGDERVRALADHYDEAIAYRRHGPDKGQSDAIAEGWRNLTGDVLGWLNADDILFPDAVARARAFLEGNPECAAVCGQSTILSETGATTGYHWAVEPPGPRLREAGIISQPSCFFRREACDAIGGLDLDLHYTMDWDLWIRLYNSGAKFGFLNEPLSMVLWGEDTKTSSFNPRRRAELKRLIGENAPKESAAKTFRSFAIHHLINRLPSEALRKTVARTLVRGRSEIFGVAGDGRLADGARISLAHYEPEAKGGARLEIENARLVAAVAAEGADVATMARSRETIAVVFAEPVPAGRKITLILSLSQGGRAYFAQAAWTPTNETRKEAP